MVPSAQKTTPKKSTRRSLMHIRELDGVRGLAAIFVFFHHICFASMGAEGWSRPIRLLRFVSIGGSYGVDIFFVLSGFLITSLLIEARGESSFYHDFYWKRALRILPLYLVCLLGVLLFIPGSRNYVLLSAFFVANFAWLFHIVGTGPFWTLAIEEQFYLIWPTVVRRRSVEQLSRWALVLGVIPILLRLVAAAFGHHNYYFTFFHTDGLAIGAFLACRFYLRDKTAPASKGEIRAIKLCFLLGAVLIAISMFPSIHARPVAFGAASGQTGVALLSGSIIAYLILHRGQRSLGFLRSSALTFFGLISYAMYMTHLYVMYGYDHLFGLPAPGDNLAYALRFFAILGSTITLCLLTRYLLELPAMSLRKYVLASPAHTDQKTHSSH